MISFFLMLQRTIKLLHYFFKQESQKVIFSFFLFTLLIGTVFYHNVEQFSYLDALYFCVMTLTTVGYGDLYPTTDLGKMFTILYVLLGVGIMTLFIASFAKTMLTYQAEKKQKKKRQ